MTLDEAIVYIEKKADKLIKEENNYIKHSMLLDNDSYITCAMEYRQLADWLKELKKYRLEKLRMEDDLK